MLEPDPELPCTIGAGLDMSYWRIPYQAVDALGRLAREALRFPPVMAQKHFGQLVKPDNEFNEEVLYFSINIFAIQEKTNLFSFI